MLEKQRVVEVFPFVGEMPERSQVQLFTSARIQRLDDGVVLAREGTECGFLPFILSGTLRVYKIGEQGKELTLYRVERGESCILTATCILNHGDFPAIAVAEGATEALLVPASLFAAYVDEWPQWRRYLFSLYAQRLDIVLSVVEEVAFHHVDSRIAAFLAENAPSGILRTTHQQLASEVGTSREVASRILKDLEAEGLISIARGLIRVIDRDALANRAGI